MIRILFINLILVVSSCGTRDADLPKPRSYPRVIYPVKEYQTFDQENCPMQFLYPTYVEIIQEETFFDEALDGACWFDMHIKSLNCKIHCSYYELENRQQFEKLIDDAFKLAGKHNVKADYIDEQAFENKHGTLGFVFGLTGPVASPYQFFLTDSTQHFLRGALYFDAKSRPDSLAPILDFVKQDMDVLLESFQWK